MNLRQLYYFKTIAELEHYTRAAEKLFVSQSNLSHSIQELEDELNVEFFVRKGRNIKLTKYGELFLPYVRQSLEQLETGIARLNDYINPNTGTVVVGGFPSLSEFIPEVIVRYFSETNRVGVHLQFTQEATYARLKERLLSGELDLVFCTWIDDPRVDGTVIGEHQIVALVPMSHPLAQQEELDLKQLDGESFVAFDKNCQLREVTDNMFEQLQVTPRISMETAQDVVMYGLVAANHGIAITPRPLSGAPYNVKILPISNDIPQRKLYLMWNKEQYIPPAAEYFRDFVVKSGLIFNKFLERHGGYPKTYEA